MLPSEKATQVVRDREGEYGHPALIYQMFARLVTALLADKLKPGEVVEVDEGVHIMIQLKQARDLAPLGSEHEDHLVDIAGYADVLYKIREGV